MDRIMTWDNTFKDRPELRLHQMRRLAARQGVELPTTLAIDQEREPLTPIINHGRWVVICPDPDCAGAELAREDGLFVCQSCWNSNAGRKILPARFPPERPELERLLLERGKPKTRSWRPVETVADLRAENEAHGIGRKSQGGEHGLE